MTPVTSSLEGCHRLRSAQALEMPVTFDMVEIDGVIDLDTLDFDDCSHFEERDNVSVRELLDRMYPAASDTAAVKVTVA